MDPFNSINPFDRDFAAYNAAVPQPQQQQAEFEPYLDEVPQLDTTAVDGIPFLQIATILICLMKTVDSPRRRNLGTILHAVLIPRTQSLDALGTPLLSAARRVKL